jgi:SAM-dependent methyltransferase
MAPPTRVRLLGPPEADGEYVALRNDGAGSEEIVHLHDYARIYETAGLYEHIVQELLECRSPQVAVAAFERALARLGLDPAQLVVLDLGAGTGLVGELAAPLGLAGIVGLDLLPQARSAARRDRPGVYRDYLVGDLAEPAADLLARLDRHGLRGLIAAGALGGSHMPAPALERALAPLAPGSPVVFTLHTHWSQTDAPGGFRTPLARLFDSGALELLERSRFRHRLSTTGAPITYELFVAARV